MCTWGGGLYGRPVEDRCTFLSDERTWANNIARVSYGINGLIMAWWYLPPPPKKKAGGEPAGGVTWLGKFNGIGFRCRSVAVGGAARFRSVEQGFR